MKDLLKQIDSEDGEFHNGDPSTGEQGTRVTDTWLNDVQAHLIDFGIELKYLLAKAELTPDPNKKTQIYDAINKIISDSKMTLTSELTNNSASIGASAHAAKKLKDLIDALTRNLGNYIPNSKKSDHIDSYSSDMVATSKAVRKLYDWCYQQIENKANASHKHVANDIIDFADKVSGLFSQSLSDNGWRKTPDGFIEQWGTLTINPLGGSGIDTQVVFPISFPSAVLNVQLSYGLMTTQRITADLSLSKISLQGMTIRQHSDRGIVAQWRAIGK